MEATFNNLILNYEYIKPNAISSDETVVLFLHEALGSVRQWKQFPEKLCSKLQLKGIVYDRQGHGLSSPLLEKRNNHYLHDYALKELPPFIEHVLNSNQKILLVGHSDGGSIALLYAHKYPEQIAGVITMAAHVINESETIEGIFPAVEAFQAGKLDGLRKYHDEKTNDLFYAWADIWRDESFVNWNISNEIGGSFPALFLQGENDQYGTGKQLEIISTQHNSGNSELIVECGHHPHLEKQEEIIQRIVDFVGQKV